MIGAAGSITLPPLSTTTANKEDQLANEERWVGTITT